MKKIISFILLSCMLLNITTAFAENNVNTTEDSNIINTDVLSDENVLYKSIQEKNGFLLFGLDNHDKNETTADFDVVMGFDMSYSMYEYDINGDKLWLDSFEAIEEQAPDNTRYAVLSSNTDGFTSDLETAINEVQNEDYTGTNDVTSMLDESLNIFDETSIDRNKGIVFMDCDKKGASVCGVPVVAGKEDMISYIHKNWIDEVFFAVPKEIPIPEQMIKDCSAMGVVIHMRLATMKSLGKNQVVEELGGYTVLSSSIHIVTPRQMFVKRAMDIAGGLVGCLFTGIAAIFLVPAIKIKSPGPAFFSQVRMGKNGRPFKIYKFRSMYMDAEERKKELMKQNNIKDGMMFKMDDDPRIIKGVGHFIRKTSLDEFPQFWNILKGDMSLVGTRPPTMDEWEKYELHHRKRLAIKPGLTGMWQVSGRSDITDFEEVVELDTKYIAEWCLKLDIEILVKTVMVVFRGSGAK